MAACELSEEAAGGIDSGASPVLGRGVARGGSAAAAEEAVRERANSRGLTAPREPSWLGLGLG